MAEDMRAYPVFPQKGDVRLLSKAKFRRRTSHEPNRMLMRENKGFFSFAFDSANVKYGV